MGCVFGLLSYVLTQFFCVAERLVTVSLCGVMACAVFLTLVLAIVFGIALGYHYSMAEEMLHNQTLRLSDAQNTRRQGNSDRLANPQLVRMTGSGEPARPLRVMSAHNHQPDIARAPPPPPPPLPPSLPPLPPPPRFPAQTLHVPFDLTENLKSKPTTEATTSPENFKTTLVTSTSTEKPLLDEEKKPAWWPTEADTWLTDSEPTITSPKYGNVFFQDEGGSAPAPDNIPEYEEYQGPLVRRKRKPKLFVYH